MKRFLVLTILFSMFTVFASDLNQRIVSLGPNITEIVYSLGLGNSLVGRSETCDYPDTCLSVTNVGSPWMPNVELIVSLKPSVVIASSLTSNDSIQKLNKLKIKTVRINHENNLEGTYNTILDVSRLLGCENKGLSVVEDIKKRIDSIRKMTAELQSRKTAVYLINWGESGDYAATGDTFINDIIETSGLENSAKEASFWKISKELLVSKNPDFIFIPYYKNTEAPISKFKSTKPYSKLKGKVLAIDGDKTERQGIRTADVVEFLAHTCYPEIF